MNGRSTEWTTSTNTIATARMPSTIQRRAERERGPGVAVDATPDASAECAALMAVPGASARGTGAAGLAPGTLVSSACGEVPERSADSLFIAHAFLGRHAAQRLACFGRGVTQTHQQTDEFAVGRGSGGSSRGAERYQFAFQ